MLYLLSEKVFSTRGMKCYCIIVCTNLSIYSNDEGMMDSVAVLIRFVLLFSKQSDVSELGRIFLCLYSLIMSVSEYISQHRLIRMRADHYCAPKLAEYILSHH